MIEFESSIQCRKRGLLGFVEFVVKRQPMRAYMVDPFSAPPQQLTQGAIAEAWHLPHQFHQFRLPRLIRSLSCRAATHISPQTRYSLVLQLLTSQARVPVALRAPPVFFNHRLQHILVQT
jgi:hypothetical protein